MTGMVRTFGAAVREWRVGEGLSLRDLADLLKLTAVEMGSIERGRADEAAESVTRQWSRIVADLHRLGFKRSP